MNLLLQGSIELRFCLINIYIYIYKSDLIITLMNIFKPGWKVKNGNVCLKKLANASRFCLR